ncbi:PilW family protein [Ferrimonas balearica]|uniref:PilW family protein n=1 Tax=Ferrimonas balearica TaxID=44012 RepID=UPI001C96F245|nr:prepilin-type N-terminal cleavage/methylation domain-containing protein [Ferrimonas balearica]MBY5981021.1 prepilin-type N-terminal cleavage/methylation domain-containing protein [Ferrimonas balearica]
MNRGRVKGFTLVELMVAAAVGLILLSALLTFFSGNLRANSTTLELSRLNQELQTAMTVIARDIRRAGYRADGLINRDNTDTAQNQAFMFLPGSIDGGGTWTPRHLDLLATGGSHADGGPYQCIVLKSDTDDYQDAVATLAQGDVVGYKMVSGRILRGGWDDTSAEADCDNIDWSATDIALTSADIEITELTFLLDPPLQAGGERLIQSIEVTLSGTVVDKPGLSLTLNQRVRLRNNSY